MSNKGGKGQRPPTRSRAVSLSIDWDNVVSSTQAGKVRKLSRFKADSVEELGFWQPGNIQFERTQFEFPTGSLYSGRWDSLGMAGFGYYTFPHEVEYEGNLRDGMFHGEGTLTYPMGQKLDGEWVKGQLVSFKYRFADGLEHESSWKYCKMPDRRYFTSIQEGLRPAGRSLLTNNPPPRKIPDGCYDTGDGFYNPATKCVMSAYTPGKILRVPTAAQEKWIMENCRKAWDEPTEYRPDLYEHWVTGRSTDSVFNTKDEAEEEESEHSTKCSTATVEEINMIIQPPSHLNSMESSYNDSSWWDTNPLLKS